MKIIYSSLVIVSSPLLFLSNIYNVYIYILIIQIYHIFVKINCEVSAVIWNAYLVHCTNWHVIIKQLYFRRCIFLYLHVYLSGNYTLNDMLHGMKLELSQKCKCFQKYTWWCITNISYLFDVFVWRFSLIYFYCSISNIKRD